MYILASFGNMIARIVRNLFYLIDDVIFSQIPKLYDLIVAIARTSPLSQASIADMAGRIYKLLAVFMIFKVTLSLIMYIVNPEDFSDKTKGVSKLVTNIVISLALLVLTPYIFSYAYQFQKIVLEDNSLATVIFGKELNNPDGIVGNAGEQMAFVALSPWITPNTNYFACSNMLQPTEIDGKKKLDVNCFGFEDVDDYIENESVCKSASEKYLSLCNAAQLNENKGNYISATDVQNYAAGLQYSNFSLFFKKNIISAYQDDDFAFDYHYLFSTAVGVILVLLLLTTCMDIALRSIKLAFLQLIAPIPILSYVDPKSGKDGMFKKWYQMCFKTFLSLFIKLLAIYFAIYIIGRVNNLVDVIDGSYITNTYIKIFIIIGALMFAKNFTKILEGLGIKLDGAGFQINPFKRLEDEALGGKKLSKLSKGALLAPVGAAKTFGKKSISALDAARNGKGLKQGWDRVHGQAYNKFHKVWDEMTPYTAEAKKEQLKGRENLNYMKEKEKFGAEVYKRANGDGKAGLKSLFHSQEYKDSFQKMNDEKDAVYIARAKAESDRAVVQEDLKAKQQQIRSQLEASRNGIERELASKKITQAEAERRLNIANNIAKDAYSKASEEAEAKIKIINKDLGTAEKRYDLANKKHDEIKKIYSDDAKLEDAFDSYDKSATREEKNELLGKTEKPVLKEENTKENVEENAEDSTEQKPSENSTNDSSPTKTINADSAWTDMDTALDRNANSTSQGSSNFEYTSSDKKENAQQRLEELLAEIRTIDPNSSEEAKKRYKELSAEIEKIERSL